MDRIHEKNSKTHVHVDGAQAWGSFNHDLTAMDCDSYSAGSHKWFLGPKETGLLYMKEKCIPNFAPKDIGYDGEMQPPPTLPQDDPYHAEFPIKDASKFELVGQRNDTNIIGLLYTADLLELIGFHRIEDRIKALSSRLRRGLDTVLQNLPQPVFEIETPSEDQQYHGIIVLKFTEPEKGGRRRKRKNKEGEGDKLLSELLFDTLYEDYKIGVSTKKGNRLRFSPHIYNTEQHIDRAVRAIETVLTEVLE